MIDRRQSLGWTPPTPERPGRVKFAASAGWLDILSGVVAAPTSSNADMLPTLPYDQGGYSACVAPSCAEAIIAAFVREGLPAPDPSIMAIWLRALIHAGDFGQNVGTQIGTALDLCVEMGIPLAADWPYDEEHRLARPAPMVDTHAFETRGRIAYHPLGEGDALIRQLERASTARYVIPFGVAVTEAFCMSRPRGTVHAPKPGEKIAGNHAMKIAGHDRPNERFLARGSWGPECGDPDLPPGYLWLGYDYLATAHDAHLVSVIGGAA